jgi:acyl dehydratase
VTRIEIGGPYFDELKIGMRFDDAPSVTLTSGLAASHQAIVGDRLRLALDDHLSGLVAGGERPLMNPALVRDLSIGQATAVT